MPKSAATPAPTEAFVLPRKVRELLAEFPDQPFAERLFKIYEEAARTIGSLGIIEFDKYEDLSSTGCPDLSVWEALAPVIGKTVMDVNRLLSAVRNFFPAVDKDSIAGQVGQAFDSLEEAVAAPPLAQQKAEAVQQIHMNAQVLAEEVSNLGERMRSPQVVSDRWNLLGDLQELRGKFRTAAQDLVFLSASALGPISREEAIPGYVAWVTEAIVARRAVVDLARLLGAHDQKVRAAPGPEVLVLVDAMMKDLDLFGRSHSYAVLRAQDKRRIVELRSSIGKLQQQGQVRLIVETVQALADFAQSLTGINRRACLIENDRERLAAASARLESAAGQGRMNARTLLAEAQKLAWDVYGRSPALDAWLRRARKREISTLTDPQVQQEVMQLRSIVSSVRHTL